MTAALHTFDHRRQVIVTPSEIKPGDWLADSGKLRRVESVFGLGETSGNGMIYIVHFVAEPGAPNNVLGFSTQAETITVWRDPASESTPAG